MAAMWDVDVELVQLLEIGSGSSLIQADHITCGETWVIIM